jgi:aminotransferase
MTDIADFGHPDDVAFAMHGQEIGVAVVPGSSFYSRTKLGSQQVRFVSANERKRYTQQYHGCKTSSNT